MKKIFNKLDQDSSMNKLFNCLLNDINSLTNNFFVSIEEATSIINDLNQSLADSRSKIINLNSNSLSGCIDKVVKLKDDSLILNEQIKSNLSNFTTLLKNNISDIESLNLEAVNIHEYGHALSIIMIETLQFCSKLDGIKKTHLFLDNIDAFFQTVKPKIDDLSSKILSTDQLDSFNLRNVDLTNVLEVSTDTKLKLYKYHLDHFTHAMGNLINVLEQLK